tara:strand:- start:2918 stop:3136 length:219 start_codon:yes stop_codon:yes gene_type:complete
MFIEYLRNAIRYQPKPRKVEPPAPIEREYPLEKQEEEAVIVEIVYEDEEEEQKLPKEYHDQPERKHALSIWV